MTFKNKTVKSVIFTAPLTLAAVLAFTAFASNADSNDIFPSHNDMIVTSDVNGDSCFDKADYNGIRDSLLSLDYENGSAENGDADGDGRTSAIDFVLLRQKYMKDYTDTVKREADDYGIEYERDDGRVLVWHEEFDGDSIEDTKMHMRGTMGSSRILYVDDDTTVRVEDGSCHMIAYYNGDDDGRPYTASHGLVTRNTMNYRYGYAEIRAKLSEKNSTWQSWWMMGNTKIQKYNWHVELDIYESDAYGGLFALHKHSNVLAWPNNSSHLRITSSAPGPGWPCEYFVPEDEIDDFHTYAFYWDENIMEFFFDGVSYGSVSILEKDDWDGTRQTVRAWSSTENNIPLPGMEAFHDNIYMIFNNEFVNMGNGGDSEFGNVARPEDMPIEYYIDYVRLWQNPETDSLIMDDDIDAFASAFDRSW